ncbi:hypothetical protein PoB_001611500 [Plakobranchus ocellatus]|uniref:Uncharacterized protein n=1 Tax=Plakobranchus ocellatus TaxID=259542 RepID=A0AAV3Z364_9GAST|nr:hypothetical protein PoB_001611500 [Plakobranchus ocellatus]
MDTEKINRISLRGKNVQRRRFMDPKQNPNTTLDTNLPHRGAEDHDLDRKQKRWRTSLAKRKWERQLANDGIQTLKAETKPA